MTDKIVYMIQRKSDGLFSKGGTSPQFNKNGKIWGNIGHLKLHLNLFIDYKGERTQWSRDVYKGCHIVQFEQVMIASGTAKLSLDDFINDRAHKVKEERRQTVKRGVRYKRQELQRQMDELDELEKL